MSLRTVCWIGFLVVLVGRVTPVEARVSEQKAAAQVHKALTLNRVVPALLQKFTNQPQYLNSDIENPIPPQISNDAIEGMLGVAAAQANALARAGHYAARIEGIIRNCPAGGTYQLQGTPGPTYLVLITFSACASEAGIALQIDGPLSIRLRPPGSNPSQLSTLAAVRFGLIGQPLVTQLLDAGTPVPGGRRLTNYIAAGTFSTRDPMASGALTGDYRFSIDGVVVEGGQAVVGDDIRVTTDTFVVHDLASHGRWAYDPVTGYPDTDDTLEKGTLRLDSVLDGASVGSLAYLFDDLRLVNVPAIGGSQVRIDGKAFVGYGVQAEPSCASGPVVVRTLATLIDNSSIFSTGRLAVDDDIQVELDASSFPSAKMNVRHKVFQFDDSAALEAAGGCFH